VSALGGTERLMCCVGDLALKRLRIEVEQRILIEILRLGDIVSPSGRSMTLTLRYFPSISSNCAHRRDLTVILNHLLHRMLNDPPNSFI